VRRGTQEANPPRGAVVAVLEEPAVVRAQCVVLDEFLAPQEMGTTDSPIPQEHEAQFTTSEVISPSGEPGVTDYSPSSFASAVGAGTARGSHSQSEFVECFPRVLQQLGMEEFPVSHTEAQITASNDGDFFRAHCDERKR